MEKPYDQYRRNVFSQNGEDGVIERLLFEILGLKKSIFFKPGKNYWAVEFGAWDGRHLSNSFNLVKNFGFNLIAIEADAARFKDLLKTAGKYPRIRPVQQMIMPLANPQNPAEKLLDTVLSENHCPEEFEILSIDIDSHDYAVWESSRAYRPKIVVIEINSSMAPGVIATHDLPGTQGNSFTATLRLGQEKGYQLVCHTGNMIFVRNDLIPKCSINEMQLKTPDLLFDPTWLKK